MNRFLTVLKKSITDTSININLVEKVEKWTNRNVFISFSFYTFFDQIDVKYLFNSNFFLIKKKPLIITTINGLKYEQQLNKSDQYQYWISTYIEIGIFAMGLVFPIRMAGGGTCLVLSSILIPVFWKVSVILCWQIKLEIRNYHCRALRRRGIPVSDLLHPRRSNRRRKPCSFERHVGRDRNLHRGLHPNEK